LKFLLLYSRDHIEMIKNKLGTDAYKVGLLDLKRVEKNSQMDEILNIVEFDILKSFELFRLKQKSPYTIFLFDQLFERGIDKLMNFNISCYKPKTFRKSDMEIFTNFDSYMISKILDNEMDELLKNTKSDFTIQNYNYKLGYQSDITTGIEKRVNDVHKQILRKEFNYTNQ